MAFGKQKLIEAREGEQLAYRHLAAILYVEYKVRLPQGKYNPQNYAHMVWLKNRASVPDKEIKKYQAGIVVFINATKESEDYQALLTGQAPATLVLDTQVRYEYVRKCW